jgi:hypothetical protein
MGFCFTDSINIIGAISDAISSSASDCTVRHLVFTHVKKLSCVLKEVVRRWTSKSVYSATGGDESKNPVSCLLAF